MLFVSSKFIEVISPETFIFFYLYCFCRV
uniref:Uncharacterized protein n=1 Tax=Rhizophora mucronata TaxID=61149 RepID=A0A2P2KIM2_RHIMU